MKLLAHIIKSLFPVKLYMGGGSSNSVPSSVDMVASQQNADLVNQQWADYQTRFQPQESNLIDQVNGNGGLQTSFLPKALYNAQADTNNAFDSANGQQSRDMSRYGQAVNPDQQQQLDTTSGLSRAAGLANANNQTIQQDQTMKSQIMSGGLGAVGVKANG